jgi:integrase
MSISNVPNSGFRTGLTIAEGCKIWLDACKSGRGRKRPAMASTYQMYESHVRLHIVPVVGDWIMSEVTAEEIVRFRDEYLESMSTTQRLKVMRSLTSVFRQCVADGHIFHDPTRSILHVDNERLPDLSEIPTDEEMGSLILTSYELAEGEWEHHRARTWRRWRALFLTFTHGGLRSSEARSLRWADVDFTKWVVRVVNRAGDECSSDAPIRCPRKRSVKIGKLTSDILESWQHEQAGGQELVFGTREGTAETHGNVINRMWRPLQRLARVVDENGKPKYEDVNAIRSYFVVDLINSGYSSAYIDRLTDYGRVNIQELMDMLEDED